MLFKRRDKPRLGELLRVALWPRRSWARSMRYVGKRVLRLSASPHSIASGFAAGAMVSVTPFVGFHFMLAAAVAYVTGGNLLASALGTAVGNPLTFPFLWAGSYRVGRWILGLGDQAAPPFDMSAGLFSHSFDTIWPVLKPMLVGAVPLGILLWFAFYVIVRTAVRSFQEARRRRLADRAARQRVRGSATIGSEG